MYSSLTNKCSSLLRTYFYPLIIVHVDKLFFAQKIFFLPRGIKTHQDDYFELLLSKIEPKLRGLRPFEIFNFLPFGPNIDIFQFPDKLIKFLFRIHRF